ncbi:MAG: hypothetical protein IAG10_16120 [Planctomycetaceae bacterium]|nr:hypothetical protein [Planctomycetaceae bacterium]
MDTPNGPPRVYDECLAAGIPMANHYSDLYIPATDETRAILKKCDCITYRPFRNQVEGGTWYDVPFAYLPYWEAAQTRKPLP